MPDYYQSCSPIGRPVLGLLGIKNDCYELECVEALQRHGWQKNAYLFNVGKYLWRLGQKPESSVVSDLKKALEYLNYYLADRAAQIEGVSVYRVSDARSAICVLVNHFAAKDKQRAEFGGKA